MSTAAKSANAKLQTEIFRYESESISIRFENNRLRTTETGQIAGVAVRTLENGQVGLAAGNLDTPVDDLISGAPLDRSETGNILIFIRWNSL